MILYENVVVNSCKLESDEVMGVTIRDIADYLHLSVSSISKALNGYSDISKETREEVEKACKALGYFPNAHARALKSGKSYNLGVLFTDDLHSGLSHPFFSEVLESFKKEAENKGYDITFLSHRLGTRQMTYAEHCHYRQIDGICIAAVDFHDEMIVELINGELPLVTIDTPCSKWPCVESDNYGGMAELVSYVLGMGHRRIAYIHGRPSVSTDKRLLAYHELLGKAGVSVPEGYIRECDYANPDQLGNEFTSLLHMEPKPSCILCSDDYAAFGAYLAALREGLRIPEDISIAGFDGIQTMQLMHPRITTVRQDAKEIGRLAALSLIGMLENPVLQSSCSDHFTHVPCTLVKGETVFQLSR